MKFLQQLFITMLFVSFGDLFARPPIVIQPDYSSGSKCLENGVPYQVPSSIYKEDECCNEEDIVLEVGAGGSTIFLAQRCKQVIAIETNLAWCNQIRARLQELNLTNVVLLYIPVQSEIELFLQRFNTDDVTVFSVDTEGGNPYYDRSRFLNAVLEKGISENLRLIILDNYASDSLFPLHYNIEVVDPAHWDIYKFNDPLWVGHGTKLCVRKG